MCGPGCGGGTPSPVAPGQAVANTLTAAAPVRYKVVYFDGSSEIVDTVEDARKRAFDISSRAPGTDQKLVGATYLPVDE